MSTMTTLERFDVVVVPFPFTDRTAEKRRPALVLSHPSDFNAPTKHAVLAMITSATDRLWALDVPISDLTASGLSVPCAVRFKLFTLDQRLILRKLGSLAVKDRRLVSAAMKRLFIA